MTELLSWSSENFFLSILALFFAGSTLWTVAESLGTIGRRTTHIHHHHSDTCRREHEKGPCQSE